MTEQQKQLAVWRLAKDIGQEDWDADDDPSLIKGFKDCVIDWKTWLLVVLNFGAVSSGTINSFFPTVVGGLGKNRIHTLLLTVPPYMLSCMVAMGVSRNADRTGERYLHFTLPLWISVAGFIISAATTSIGARLLCDDDHAAGCLHGIHHWHFLGLKHHSQTIVEASCSYCTCKCDRQLFIDIYTLSLSR
ncbi:uncharacterized protein LDX57_012123 [Aspergillus melleus]|uniref:uncharacterized protein n=1 Tax=Aspergillus melleus TaxID=138277 RepID=UPI001E8EBE55|nr:uncharacterized protein LDX57_012123 [Aspergillus melleus]KAH8434478.1 hypothetical protein LDX57_012123 [Aspergillus melleus]